MHIQADFISIDNVWNESDIVRRYRPVTVRAILQTKISERFGRFLYSTLHLVFLKEIQQLQHIHYIHICIHIYVYTIHIRCICIIPIHSIGAAICRLLFKAYMALIPSREASDWDPGVWPSPLQKWVYKYVGSFFVEAFWSPTVSTSLTVLSVRVC